MPDVSEKDATSQNQTHACAKKRTGSSRVHQALETHLLNINTISRGSITNVRGFTSKSPVIRDFVKPGSWADAKK